MTEERGTKQREQAGTSVRGDDEGSSAHRRHDFLGLPGSTWVTIIIIVVSNIVVVTGGYWRAMAKIEANATAIAIQGRQIAQLETRDRQTSNEAASANRLGEEMNKKLDYLTERLDAQLDRR